MNGEAYELEVRREIQNAQALNCAVSGQLGQAWGSQYLSPYWVAQPCTCPSLGDYEITIQQIGDGEPLLNYGPKLRLLIADPIKGIDLRESLAKLKSALKRCKNEH